MTPYLTHRDTADENDAKPRPRKVCIMCYGQGVLYRPYSDVDPHGSPSPCPTCHWTGRQ